MTITLDPKISSSLSLTLGTRSIYLPVKYGVNINGIIETDNVPWSNLQESLQSRAKCLNWLKQVTTKVMVPMVPYFKQNVYENKNSPLTYEFPLTIDEFDSDICTIGYINAWIDVKYDPNKTKSKQGVLLNSTTNSAVTLQCDNNSEAFEVLNQVWYILVDDLKLALNQYFTVS